MKKILFLLSHQPNPRFVKQIKYLSSNNEVDAVCYNRDYMKDLSSEYNGACGINKSIGIKYDFSVLSGMKKDNLPKHYYDYKKAPQKDFWKFEDDVLKEDDKGSFIEVPTTIVKMNIFDVYRLKKSIKRLKTIGDGKGADDSSNSFIRKLKKLKPLIKYTLSSDYMTFNMFQKNIQSINKSFLVYVAHPKNFSDESFSILEYMCNNYNAYNYKELVHET